MRRSTHGPHSVRRRRSAILGPVSQQNVEIVRRFLRAGVEEALADADPEIVWNPVEELPTQGHGAVRASLTRWKAEWNDYELLPEDFLDIGDHVVVTVRVRGRGRGSGIEIDARCSDVFTLRSERIVRMDQFAERAEALDFVRRSTAVSESSTRERDGHGDHTAGTSRARDTRR